MPLLQVLSQSQDVEKSAQLTGRGGTGVGQHRRLPAAQVCVKPDLCIDWILQAVIKRNRSQDQRLNEYLDISSIYTFIHIYIYTPYLYLMFLGFFQPQGFNSATSCFMPTKKRRCSLVGLCLSGETSDRSRGWAAPLAVFAWWQATQSPNIVYQCTCGSVWHVDFSVGKYGSIHFLKKKLGPWCHERIWIIWLY